MSSETAARSTNPRLEKGKRTMYDLEDTFEVIVGQPLSGSKTFTLHTEVIAEHSEFLIAARKPQWTAGAPKEPVHLESEDPNLFRTYLNCVYFGPDTLKQWGDDHLRSFQDNMNSGDALLAARLVLERLAELYLLGCKMVDHKIANMAIDEFINFKDSAGCWLSGKVVKTVYENTEKGHILRQLLRDYWIYESYGQNPEDLQKDGYNNRDFVQDVAVGLLNARNERPKSLGWKVSDLTSDDVCYYHWHDTKHPRCAPKKASDDKLLTGAVPP